MIKLFNTGFTATNLQTNRFPFWEQINAAIAMNGPDGAVAQIIAASDSAVTASVDTMIGPKFYMFGFPNVQGVAKLATDRTLQQQLWQLSEQVIGANFSVEITTSAPASVEPVDNSADVCEDCVATEVEETQAM